MNAPYQSLVLKNGIRIVHRYTDAYVAHCGIIINTGSRDDDSTLGMAHFLEHVLFKGTQKRRTFNILSHLENVGGELNAFTSKEDTFVYASFINAYYERSIDIISDIIFNSTFPEKEIKKEKEVVVDEINSYKDSPSELIFDDFEDLIFTKHNLGNNILGTPQHIKTFNKQLISQFVSQKYNTDQMVFCSYGKIAFEQLKKLTDKYLAPIPANFRNYQRIPVNGYSPRHIHVNKKTFQTHCIIGNRSYSHFDDKKNAMILLSNILGGPGLNSRLNLAIREKYGFCYSVEASYTSYTDTGVFSIYAGTDKDYVDKTIDLIYKQLKLLREQKLGVLQLKRAKQQLIGQIAISNDVNNNEFLSMGKSFLYFNKIDTIDEVNTKVENITATQLLEVANEMFIPETMSSLIYKAK